MPPLSPRLLTTLTLLVAVLANSIAPIAKAQEADGITSAQVNEAIARGVRYLKSQQRPTAPGKNAPSTPAASRLSPRSPSSKQGANPKTKPSRRR